jgi:hypothetical protein
MLEVRMNDDGRFRLLSVLTPGEKCFLIVTLLCFVVFLGALLSTNAVLILLALLASGIAVCIIVWSLIQPKGDGL